MPISPYYRHFMPEHKSQILHDRVVTTISEGKTHVTLYTNITAHELGIRVSSFEDGEVTHTGCMIVRTIKKRPITARRSIWDDGSIFQFWEYHTGTRSNPVTVLFGYTTDPEVRKVQLKLGATVIPLNLYDQSYFVCITPPNADKIVELQGQNSRGKVVRTWNGRPDYLARRSWLSFLVQTYPYVVETR